MASYDPWIGLASRKYKIPTSVLKGLIKVESGGDEGAISPAGAFGLTQFMPGTAKSYGVKRGNARSQILGAAHYLSDLGFRKDPKLALSSYNAGPGNPGAAGDYADKVLAAAGSGGQLSRGGGISPIEPVGAGPQVAAAQGPSLFATLGALSSVTNPDSLSSRNYQFLNALQTLSGPEPSARTGGGIQGAGMLDSPAPGIEGIISRMSTIERAHPKYLWGGGHGSRPAKLGTPVDCSGAVAQALGIDPRVSGEFKKWGKPGRGQVTVYSSPSHVLMEVNGHFWGTSGSNPGGGAGWIPRSAISPGYLKKFTARHL